MNCLKIINRGLSRFGLALVRMQTIAEMNRMMEQLETDKLSLSDRLIEMDRMNATPRCDAATEGLRSRSRRCARSQSRPRESA